MSKRRNKMAKQKHQLSLQQQIVDMYRIKQDTSLIAKHFGVEESFVVEVVKEYGFILLGDSLSPKEALQDARKLLAAYYNGGGDAIAVQKMMDRIGKILVQAEV